MKLDRELIYSVHSSWEDNETCAQYFREIEEVLSKRIKQSSWTCGQIISEAMYQATALLLDFSEHIYFEHDYYEDALKSMPVNIANAVFSVTDLLLRNANGQESVRQMIALKLQSKPIFKALRKMKVSPEPISLFPHTPYFQNLLYVDWGEITNGLKVDNIVRILNLAEPEGKQIQATIATAISGQAQSAQIKGDITASTFSAVEWMLEGKGLPKGNDILASYDKDEEIQRLRRMLAQEREKLAETEEYILSGIGKGAALLQIEDSYKAEVNRLQGLLDEKEEQLRKAEKKNETPSDGDTITLQELSERIIAEENEVKREELIDAMLRIFDEDSRWQPYHAKIKKKKIQKKSDENKTQINIGKVDVLAAGGDVRINKTDTITRRLNAGEPVMTSNGLLITPQEK